MRSRPWTGTIRQIGGPRSTEMRKGMTRYHKAMVGGLLPRSFSLFSNRVFNATHWSHFRHREQSGTRHAQVQIVNALRMGKRESASMMLLSLGHGNGSLKAEDFAYILEYCAQTPDPLFVMETWRIMEEKAVEVNKRCWRFIIRALSKGGYLNEAFNWLRSLGQNDSANPVLPMYNIFLSCCAKTQSLIHADCCLELMEDRLVGKSEITYWELLKRKYNYSGHFHNIYVILFVKWFLPSSCKEMEAKWNGVMHAVIWEIWLERNARIFDDKRRSKEDIILSIHMRVQSWIQEIFYHLRLAVWQKNPSAVHEIWKDCTKYYSPSIVTLRKFVWSFTRLRDLEPAYNALQQMVALACQGTAAVMISATGRYRLSRLDIPIPSFNELPIERFGLKASECPLPSVFEGSSVKTKEGIGGNCMALSSSEKKSLYNKEDLNLDRVSLDASHMSNTTDIGFSATLQSRTCNEVEKGCSNSQMFPGIPTMPLAAGTDDQSLAFKQDCTEFSMKKMEQQGSGFGVLKDVTSVAVMKVLRWSFNDLIHACARSRRCEMAEQLFQQMHDLGLEPSQYTYDGLVKAVLSEKEVAYGVDVVKAMDERKLKPYNDTLAALSIGYSKNLELDLAEALLYQFSDSLPKYIHPFNAFLSACDAMDQPERAVRILAKMKHLNIKSDIRTYELLFSLFGNVNAPYEKGNILSHVDVAKRIHTIERDMMENGVQHSYASMENLIRALGAEGMIQEQMRYLHVAENLLHDINPYRRTVMYNSVLHALVEAKESHAAIEVFRNMKLSGFSPDAATYNIMIDCCSILRCFKSACAVVSMMLRDGFCPQTCTYTALMKILLANEDFDKALSLLDQSNLEGIQPDILLFNTILLEAYLKGRIDIIELIIERMHEENIQPDPSTCWYTFSAYVDHGFYSTAMEALQVLSMRMISEDDTILQENRASFEDLVQNEDPDVELQIIEIFKESREYLAAALLNLRWCAITGSSISWLPKESLWARRLSSCYGVRKGAT